MPTDTKYPALSHKSIRSVGQIFNLSELRQIKNLPDEFRPFAIEANCSDATGGASGKFLRCDRTSRFGSLA